MNSRLASVIIVATILAPNVYTTVVFASTLEKETLPLNTSGSPIAMNVTADAEDIDITIDPLEDISTPNGTQTISTTGATDIDINDFPPVGISIIIQNETVSVTENQVSIADAIDTAVAQQAPAAIQQETANAEEESLNLQEIEEGAEGN